MKKKIKGFTLIELIVVMAIFSIILAAAWSFLPIAMKITTLANARHDGAAAVTDISQYLKNELSAVEYIDVYNYAGAQAGVPDASPETAVKRFVHKYYEGVLRKDSTTSALNYGSGLVHVLTIDNSSSGHGKISRYTYNCQFNPHADYADMQIGSGSQVINGVTIPNGLEIDSAINRAYYDDYNFRIQLGTFDNPTADANGNGTPDILEVNAFDYAALATYVNVDRTQFTILGTSKKNPSDPKTFSSSASLTLVNILARGSAPVKYYYVLNPDATDPGDVSKAEIVSIENGGNPLMINAAAYGGRSEGSIFTPLRLYYFDGDPDHYTFVYSYGAEIDVK